MTRENAMFSANEALKRSYYSKVFPNYRFRLASVKLALNFYVNFFLVNFVDYINFFVLALSDFHVLM